MLLIDPPSGWMYGFPKPYHNPDNLPLSEWLAKNGYPQAEIDQGMHKYCRFIGNKEDLDRLPAHEDRDVRPGDESAPDRW